MCTGGETDGKMCAPRMPSNGRRLPVEAWNKPFRREHDLKFSTVGQFAPHLPRLLCDFFESPQDPPFPNQR